VTQAGVPAPRAARPGGGALARLDSFIQRVAASGVLVLLACALLNCFDIATRRGLPLQFVGSVDLTQLLVMTCAFLCIPLTFLREAQVEVDFVATRLNGRTFALLRCAGALAGAAFMAMVTGSAAGAALQAWQHGDRSATLATPLTWYWAPVVLGCALSVLACAAVALRHGLAAWRPPA
jgi:TRAP-type C4-dicarboxylate transport system permease small subunit